MPTVVDYIKTFVVLYYIYICIPRIAPWRVFGYGLYIILLPNLQCICDIHTYIRMYINRVTNPLNVIALESTRESFTNFNLYSTS